jgi:hypothetical protein
MKNVSKALLAVAAVAVPGIVLGENPAWTYGQVGYYRADSGDDATDGFQVKGSLGFAENFHFQAEYIDGTIGTPGSDIDFDGYELTIGAHPSVGENTDAVLAFHYFDSTVEDIPTDLDSDGFGIGAGLRHMLTSNVEVNAMAWWDEGEVDLSGGGNEDFTDIRFEIGGRYLFNDNFSAGVTIDQGDDLDSVLIDVRYQFDDLL